MYCPNCVDSALAACSRECGTNTRRINTGRKSTYAQTPPTHRPHRMDNPIRTAIWQPMYAPVRSRNAGLAAVLAFMWADWDTSTWA
jgi:hypothetical protein